MNEMNFMNINAVAVKMYRFGKSMRDRAIAMWVYLGINVIIIIIFWSALMVPMMASDMTLETMKTIVIAALGTIGVLALIGFFGGVFILICYIQFLFALKQAVDFSNDANLRKTFKLEIVSAVGSIILPIILLFSFTRLRYNMYSYEEMYDWMFQFVGLIFLMGLLGLVLVVLKIVGLFALAAWGESLQSQYFSNPAAHQLAESTSFMKWGQVIALFFGSVGIILFTIGLQKAGKACMTLFATPLAPSQSQNLAINAPSFYGEPPPPLSSPLDNSENSFSSNSQWTYPPARNQATCPTCGKVLFDPNVAFCDNCGRKLR